MIQNVAREAEKYILCFANLLHSLPKRKKNYNIFSVEKYFVILNFYKF